MTVVVLGIDALDPDLVSETDHPNLTLTGYKRIETIPSSTSNEPSTHELWPSIITGLHPEEHGLQLEDGVTWEHPLLQTGSAIAAGLLPHSVRNAIGAWLLENTAQEVFRTPASYYEEQGLSTVFDDVEATPIGIPNYVVNPEDTDREHELRNDLGDLFEFDPTRESKHKHTTSNVLEFYDLCLEMSMVRVARARRALRSRTNELVFVYTSALDLIGHVSYDDPAVQQQAYAELDEFVGELRSDLAAEDELVLVSDHGLQDGLHTDVAMIAATGNRLVDPVDSVLDVKEALLTELAKYDHTSIHPLTERTGEKTTEQAQAVQEHLEDLGYM